MLKRSQVLLTDWLEDYVRHISERYDYSFSEIIRLSLCILFCEVLSEVHPKHKIGINVKEVVKAFRRIPHNKIAEEKRHQLISKIYFEARKAIEFNLSHCKEKNNNNNK
jgi:hypothetical protein